MRKIWFHRSRLALAALSALVIGCAISIIAPLKPVFATPALNFNSTILAQVLFAHDINTNSNSGDHHGMDMENRHEDHHDSDKSDHPKAEIKTEGASDVYYVDNMVPPGGNSGWHTHPGPSVVAVKTGVAAVYDGDDKACKPHYYAAGTGFVDAGDGHVHMVRNEGSVQLELVAFQILPAGTARRIDAPNPGHCAF